MAKHVAAANALADAGLLSEALGRLALATAIDEQSFEVRANEALLLSELLDKGEHGVVVDGKTTVVNTSAVSNAFQLALALNPGWADGWFNLGNAQNQGQDAISSFQKAIQLSPKFADAHNNISICYQKSRELEPAIKHGNIAVQLEPSNSQYVHNLASYLHQAGSFTAALTPAQRATKLNPDNWLPKQLLAAILKDSNQPDASAVAAKVLEQALRCKGLSSEVRLTTVMAV